MRSGTGLLVFMISLIAAPMFAGTPAALNSPRQVQLFDEGWKFLLGDAPGASEPAFNDSKWRSLNLPHDWSIELPFDAKLASGTGYLPGGYGWYRKSFRWPSPIAGKQVSVLFDGIYMNSEVWINGHYLGKRPNGYVSFSYDITPYLVPGNKRNVLAVRVDHSKFADSRWYTGSGIYRHVWIVATSDLHIAQWGIDVSAARITPQSASIIVKTRIRNDGMRAADVALETTIRDGAGRIVATARSSSAIPPRTERVVEQTAEVAEPATWSPDNPRLYKAAGSLKSGSAILDADETPFGIRSFIFDADRGFFLNGVRTPIKGVCIHHDAGCLGAAVPEKAWVRRLQLLKELGCNAIRMSHNPPAPELLDLCDTMGFLVMDEAFDEWAKPKRKWIEGWNVGKPGLDGYAKYFDEWAIRDIRSMVERDRNHPSIILWSIGNEIDYDRDPYFDPESKDYAPGRPSAAELPAIAARLVKAVKDVDTSRPVTAALANITVSNRFGLADLLDVVGYNYLEKFYVQDHGRYPGRKILGSENSHAYSAWKIMEDLAFVSGQFLWTGFDFLGEARQWPVRSSSAGLLDQCGFKKPAFYFRQSLWSEKPMVYIASRMPAGKPSEARALRPEAAASWNLPVKEGDPIPVVAYTNCETVELFLNETSLGEKTLASAQEGVLSWEVPYAPGALKAVGRNRGADAATCVLPTSGKQERIKLSADATSIIADGRDLSHVEVSLVDNAGNTVYTADNKISFEVSGKGRIAGVDNGDIRSHESFKASSRAAYQGKCLVIIQSTAEAGTIRLRASAPGMIGDQIEIKTAAPLK